MRALRKSLFALALVALCALAPLCFAASADWLFTASGVTATATSTYSYDLGGPGMVSVRIYGVSGTASCTVIIEEKLRSDEETWGTVATLGTSFATTAGTWTGPASGIIRVRVSAYTSGTVKGTIAAWSSTGVRIVPSS